MAKALAARKEVSDLGVEMYINTALVHPRPDQPRKHFDLAELRDLAGSIRVAGQIQSGIVRPLRGEGENAEYELIDGERRLRACKMIGKQFRAVVRNVNDPKQIFLMSAMANFGKADHTPLEIAHALHRIKTEFDMTQQDLATHFGKSPGWAGQYLGLLKLDPKVQELMSPVVPEKQRIKFWTAVTLSTFSPEEQIKLANDISQAEMSEGEARAVIRRRAAVLDTTEAGGHKQIRSPNRDYNQLDNFVRNLNTDSELLLDLTPKRFEAMFASRPKQDRSKMVRALLRGTNSLEQITTLIAGHEKDS